MSQRPTLDDALGFYQQILHSLMMTTDDQGLVSGFSPDGLEGPITVPDGEDRKRLVLPTRENLRQPNWEGKMAFHPLSESVYRGESPIIKKLKRTIVSRLNIATTILLRHFIDIACDTENHGNLSSKQTRILECVPDPDDKTLADLTKVADNFGKTSDDEFFTLYLKHGGRYKGKECSRLAVVDFPIMEQLEDEKTRSVFGVKLRVKDFKALKNLFLYIFPDAEQPEAYNHGVLSEDNASAPYFRALMGAFYNVAHRLNARSWLFRKHLNDYEIVHIPLDWVDGMDHLDAFRELIPPLTGNDGAPGPLDQHTQPTPQEAAPGQTASKESSQGLSWSEIRNRMQSGMATPQQPAMPAMAPPQQPVPSWMRQGGGQPQVPQQPPVPPGFYASDPRLQPAPAPSWLGGGGNMAPQQPMQQNVPSWQQQQPMQGGQPLPWQNQPPSQPMGGGGRFR